ncbi:tetratricopeptide repeat protein [Pseudomonas sp. NPDC090755]|uniref:tetratricopeptide repeat protein n=1 Tax=Pseudomonas sp. NPDC090755 TaxID=3364481 RepID=UPI00383AD56A
MSFRLSRKELVDTDQLSKMLEHSPGKAAQAILASAGQGVVEAQVLLGQILLDGRGIEQDPRLARQWFEIAARNGHPMGHNMLGRSLEHGWGGPQNLEIAAQHYRQAAALGLDWGLYNYANLLATGRGVGQDHAAALGCYQQAADLGHAKSMNLVGRYLEQGVACRADIELAHTWYRRSAEAGDFRGQFSFATVLFESGALEQAQDWFNRALTGGNLNFLRVATRQLEVSGSQALGALAQAYRKRLEYLETGESKPAAIDAGSAIA